MTATAAPKTQIRGNCQCCGRQQAFQRGTIAQHGYTVDHGYFEGVCSGHKFQPLQLDRTQTDSICAYVRADAINLLDRAAKLESGKTKLKLVVKPNTWTKRGEKPEMVEFDSLASWDQKSILRSEVYKLESRAKAGNDFADQMEKLADALHGTELVTVVVSAAPAAIHYGEKRVSEKGNVIVCDGTEKGRVYYKITNGSGKVFRTWMGTASWRKLAIAE